MNQLRSINLDVVKRPRVLAAIGGILLLLIIFYFAWWSPEGQKLSSVKSQEQAQVTQIATLQANLRQTEEESEFVSKYQTYLTFFSDQVPVLPEEGQLVFELGRLSDAVGVDLTSVNADTTAAPVPPATLSTIPVTMTVTGAHERILRFLAGIYSLPRLITIQSIQPSAVGAGSGPTSSYNVLRHDSVPFSITISGTAYFSGTVTTAP